MPRPHDTYRGSPNRYPNSWGPPIEIKDGSIPAHKTPRLNRSAKWALMKNPSYLLARAISPSKEPVR